jgi:hypothetical protein
MIFHCCPVDLTRVEHFGQAVCIFRQLRAVRLLVSKLSIGLHALIMVVAKKRSGKTTTAALLTG